MYVPLQTKKNQLFISSPESSLLQTNLSLQFHSAQKIKFINTQLKMAARRSLRIALLPGDGIGQEVIPVCIILDQIDICYSYCTHYGYLLMIDICAHRPAAESWNPSPNPSTLISPSSNSPSASAPLSKKAPPSPSERSKRLRKNATAPYSEQ